MGRARMLITPELLLELFPLPKTARIMGSSESHTYVEVIVEDPALPEVAEGAAMTVIVPRFKDNESRMNYGPSCEFVDWGIRPGEWT